jgi:uncharacterized membrane protein
MEGFALAWLNLLLRWAHFIVGVAWIGASFYFNWLENHLRRNGHPEHIAGDLWAVHGGGFYHLRKLAVAPAELPPQLHWFKWEAYATWLTGFALLCVVFYWQARSYMIDPQVAMLSPAAAITIGLAALATSWLAYDGICRIPALSGRDRLLGLLVFGWFALLAVLLSQCLSGRAAYLHVGAAMGTVMVANVFRVIIPAQKDLVAAVGRAAAADASKARAALQRSRHNNYLTLPVLFIMLSAHFPATYGNPYSWLVLSLIAAAGVAVRHYFNVRHLPGRRYLPLLWAAALLSLAAWLTAPPSLPPAAGTADAGVDTGAAFRVVQERCTPCHAAAPAHAGLASAPLAVELDSRERLLEQADRVHQAVVVHRTMPLGNATGMTEEERQLIASWFATLHDSAEE